jgi:peptidoglycan biosynthesis protein MviN/MurJ (putative lipid II flippase)
LYAKYQMGKVLAVNGLQTGVRLLANLIFISFWGYIGLAVSAALGLSIQALILGWIVRRQLGGYIQSNFRRIAGLVTFASLIAVFVAGSLDRYINTSTPFLSLVVSGGLGAVTYGVFMIIPKLFRNVFYG